MRKAHNISNDMRKIDELLNAIKAKMYDLGDNTTEEMQEVMMLIEDVRKYSRRYRNYGDVDNSVENDNTCG